MKIKKNILSVSHQIIFCKKKAKIFLISEENYSYSSLKKGISSGAAGESTSDLIFKFQKKIKCFSNAAEESILYVTIFILQTKAEFLQSNTHQ